MTKACSLPIIQDAATRAVLLSINQVIQCRQDFGIPGFDFLRLGEFLAVAPKDIVDSQ